MTTHSKTQKQGIINKAPTKASFTPPAYLSKNKMAHQASNSIKQPRDPQKVVESRGVNDTLLLASYSGSAREKLEFGSVIIEPSSSSSRARAIERAEFEYTNTRLEQAREPNELLF